MSDPRQAQKTEKLVEIAKAVSTPGDIDSAPESGEYGFKEAGKWYSCPACDGQGEVPGDTFCNFDDKPLGVQFFGIGAEPGEWQAYFRAFTPKTVLALLSRLEECEGALRKLERAASDVLVGISVHNRLHADAPARRDNIEGPVISALWDARSLARSTIQPRDQGGE